MRRLLRAILGMKSETLVRIACWLGLVALPMMAISVIHPTVWPVLAALSLGQVIGTLSLAVYLVAVVRDLRLFDRLFGKRGG